MTAPVGFYISLYPKTSGSNEGYRLVILIVLYPSYTSRITTAGAALRKRKHSYQQEYIKGGRESIELRIILTVNTAGKVT